MSLWRYSAGVKTSAGSATLPIISLYGSTTRRGTIREIGVFNTTATAVELKLTRITTAGTKGAGLTEAKHDPSAPTAALTAFTTHTVAPTLGDDLGYSTMLGAAAGSGVIWTFGGSGLVIDNVATDAIGVIVATGTGQVCYAYIVWDEHE